MKNMFHLIFTLAAFAVVMLFGSCDREVNEWPVESAEEKLFKPLVLEYSLLKPTEVELKYTGSMNAKQYVFEFSKDSFATIEKQVVVLADTVKPFAENSNPMRVEYRSMFTELDGTTKYFVRMCAVGGPLKSSYISYVFTTPAEFLFTRISMSLDRILYYWNPEAAVTNIVLKQGDALIEDRVLSAEEKAAGMAAFTGLNPGTPYTATIHNGNVLRGTFTGRTTGIAGGNFLEVKDADNAATVNSALTELVRGGAKNITVAFAPGRSYTMGGAINIPVGVENIDFVGAENESGVRTLVQNVYVRIATPVPAAPAAINNVTFQGLEMTGSGQMFFEVAADQTFNRVLFENCYVSNINSVVRLVGSTAPRAVGDSVVVNNCWITQTGGWSFLNVGSGGLLNEILVSNTTLTEMDTRFADIRSKTNVLFKNVTACNIVKGMGHLWNLDNNALATITLENCIISGPNGGVKLNSTAGDYAAMPSYFGGNYKTSDLLESTRLLNGIGTIPLDIYGLFINPAASGYQADFHIKKGTGFAGTGVAGDPRWFD